MNFGAWLEAEIKKEEAKVKDLLTNATTELKTILLPAAISAVNVIKNVVNFDSSDLIGDIAGKIGGTIEDKIRITLNKIVPELQLSQQFLSLGSPELILQAVLKSLTAQGVSVGTKTAFYIELAGQIATDFADGKFTIAEGMEIAQEVYKEIQSPTSIPQAA